MQVVVIVQRSSPVHQCGKYNMLVGVVVVEPSVELPVSMGRFTVHSTARRTIRSPVSIYTISISRNGRWPSVSDSMPN
jgi:hypothetical protein